MTALVVVAYLLSKPQSHPGVSFPIHAVAPVPAELLYGTGHSSV
jgi:hypothetical protein